MALMQLSTLVTDNFSHDNYSARVLTILEEIESYQQNIIDQDNSNAQHATKLLRELQGKFGVEEIIARSKSVDSNTGLRCRASKKLVLNSIFH